MYFANTRKNFKFNLLVVVLVLESKGFVCQYMFSNLNLFSRLFYVLVLLITRIMVLIKRTHHCGYCIVVSGKGVKGTQLRPPCTKFSICVAVKSTNVRSNKGNTEQIKIQDS